MGNQLFVSGFKYNNGLGIVYFSMECNFLKMGEGSEKSGIIRTVNTSAALVLDRCYK